MSGYLGDLKVENKKVRVSGVPYEVDASDLVSELERENAMMRARMDRLEQECKELEGIIHTLNMQLYELNQRLEKL